MSSHRIHYINMDSLRTSYKDFLTSVKKVAYEDFDDDQKLTMAKIMHKLKSWFMNTDNIDSFVRLYGKSRLREITVILRFYIPSNIKEKYSRKVNDDLLKLFMPDYAKYIMCRDIHADVTIDIVSKYLGSHTLDSHSLFFYAIALFAGCGDSYYLTLLEEFGNTVHILNILYGNIGDKELFLITMFKNIKPFNVVDFFFNIDPTLTQEMMDIFAQNILAGKYDDDTCFGYCMCIIAAFKERNISFPYEEFVDTEFFVHMIQEKYSILLPQGGIVPQNVCDIIAEHSNDNVSVLKIAIEKEHRCDSHTIKLAKKNGNMKCVKYMKKHLNKK